MNKIHFWVGIIGILVFIGTGQYMQHYQNALQDMNDAPRLLYRSAHIYLLLSAIMNLAVGVYIPSKNNEFSWYKYMFSGAIILAPIIITVGFFIEPSLTGLYRPYTSFAVKMLFLFSTFIVIILSIKWWVNILTKNS